MFRYLLAIAISSLSSAQFHNGFGWHPNIACPYEPPRPKSGRDVCDWIPLKHPLSGCIMRWRCEEVEPSSKPCPEAPAKPTSGRNCNWVAMRDARGCILDYECEPVTQPPCPRRPQRPDNNHLCYYRAIKNNDGCVVDYECEPLGGGFAAAPRRFIAPRPVFRAPPIAAPIPTPNFGAAFHPQLQQAAAAAQATNAAVLQSSLAQAQAQANAVNAATIGSLSAAAASPRIPVLKDEATETSRGFCVDRNEDVEEWENPQTGLRETLPKCVAWAKIGECQNNPDYMDIFCTKSCRRC